MTAPALTIDQVAAWLRVHRSTVETWIRRGDLDCVRLGDGKRARIRVTAEQLSQFIRERSGSYRAPALRRVAR